MGRWSSVVLEMLKMLLMLMPGQCLTSPTLRCDLCQAVNALACR